MKYFPLLFLIFQALFFKQSKAAPFKNYDIIFYENINLKGILFKLKFFFNLKIFKIKIFR